MHRLIVLCLFLWVLAGVSAGAQETVYICTGGSSVKYHKSSHCPSASNCSGIMAPISRREAEKMGRTPCKRCFPKPPAPTGFLPFSSNSIELAKTKKGRPQQVIQHVGYTVSYNSRWLLANWVAYALTPQEVQGTVKRPKRTCEPDPNVTGPTAEHSDYSNSGYVRGHLAPAGDMKWSERAMNESFFTTNICPQDESLNNGRWKRLEEHIRHLAAEGTVYICCGPIVERKPLRIGVNGVAVPDKFFKVICMKRKGKWQAIGFIFPNVNCPGGLDRYAVSVDKVEELTGHDFFFNLPDNIENAIETTCQWKDWQ